jgi:hypothetical protein
MVDNYLEAVGVMAAIRAGIATESIRRPLNSTEVSTKIFEEKTSFQNIEKNSFESVTNSA